MESNINFQKKNLFRNLIIKTCLVLFLSLIVYISYFGFKKKYQPLFLSKFQVNQSKGNQNLLQNSSDVVNYSYASSLSRCGLGQCVIDIESGVKRCPESVGAGPLIYDILTEACTNLESCDYEDIPFAVKTDGSANSNMCEINPNGERIPCRCTDKKACKPHVVSKFKTIEGKTFGFQENYAPEKLVIAQEISTDQSHLGFYNIPIENSAEEFCEINPAFTEEIVNGCNFKNSLGDKLGCEFIETVNFTAVNVSPLGWQLSEQVGSLVKKIPGFVERPQNLGGDSNKNVVEWQNYVILGVPLGQWESQDDLNLNLKLPGVIADEVPDANCNPGDPPPGYLKFVPEEGGNTEIVSYECGIIPLGYDYPVIRSQQYVFAILYNIRSVFTSPLAPNHPPGTYGFAFKHEENIKGDKGGPGQLTVITQQLMTSTFCRFTNDTANYKNMLLCTREQNEVCNYGRLSYNIENLGGLDINNMDENYSRNFCQLNMQRSLDNINSKYLNDPINHTMSCSLGPGCDGKYFQQPTDDVSVEAKNRYFPEVDIDGINGVWDITIDTFPTLVEVKGGLVKGNQLLNIDNINPGDYWSIKSVNEVLLASEGVSEGGSIIPVEDLFGLNIFIGQNIGPSVAPSVVIGGTSYLLTSANYQYINKKNISSIGISPGLSEGVSFYDSINIVAANVNRGDTYGIVIQKEITNSYKSFYKVDSPLNDSPRYEFARLDGVPIGQDAIGTRVSLTVYKQFSFSGGNYGTKVMKNLTEIGVSDYGNFNRRLYTNEGTSPYVFKVADDNDKKTYPYPPQDLNQLDLNQVGIADPTKNTSFDSISAPYKIPMSMYYPVWNKALGQQECVRCKPIFIAHSVINFLDKLENVIIQFSGKDFGNYQYNARDDMYCYVTTSKAKFDNINKADITSRRIVLQEPNPNIQVGDYVLDSTLQLPFQISPSKDFADFQTRTFKRLQICPQIFPSDEAVRNMKDTNGGQVVHDNWNKTNNNQGNGKAADVYPFSFGLDESTSENFVFEGNTLFPNQEGTISKNGNTYTFVNTGASLPNNYFFGKKYQDASLYNGKLMEKIEENRDPEIYTDGFYFVPTSKVERISEDGTVIELNSPYPYKITNPGDDVYFQFCRLDHNLKIKVAYPSKEATDEFEEVYADTEVKINAITDSRISDVIVTESSSNFSKSNPPIIKLDLENQNFI